MCNKTHTKQLNTYNPLGEIYSFMIENDEQIYYFTIKIDDDFKEGTLNNINITLANIYPRGLYNSYSNLTFVWMATNHCFPNDKIIEIGFFPYIRLFQNFIVVGCFAVIFIFYAFICIFVSRRRQLKVNRANYYKGILFRSKQNTNGFKSEIMSNNNSNMGLSDLKKQTAAKKKNIGFENPNKELLTPSNDEFTDKLQTTENFEFKSTYSCDSNLNDHRLSIEQEENNNKSTQTVSSTIAKIKYNQSLKKPKVKIEDHDALENANYNVSYSNTLLANLKTAFMLFVVTLIMAIVYTPALLTSMGYLAYNPIHWNIIYINNAANPLLYSFLNSNFRKSLKNFFSRLM